MLLQSLSSFCFSKFLYKPKDKGSKNRIKENPTKQPRETMTYSAIYLLRKISQYYKFVRGSSSFAHKFSSKFEGDTLVEIYGDMKNLSFGDFGKRVIDAPQVGNHYKTILWSTKTTKTGV